MKDENKHEIHLNANGAPDVDYYVAKAHELRNEAMLAGLRAIKAWLFKKHTPAPQKAGTQARRSATQSGWPWVDMILQNTTDRTRHA